MGVALLFLIVAQLIYFLGFGVFRRLASRTRTDLDDQFIHHARLPAQFLIFLATSHVFFRLTEQDPFHLERIVIVCELLLLAYIAIEVFQTFILRYWLAEKQKIQIPAVVRHLIIIILYVIAFLSVIGLVTGINLIPLLATSTVITVVLGLALQDTLGNLFAGLALHIERPFSTGDWILVDNIEGQVIHTGWRSTQVKTFSGDLVSFPNSTIAKARVHNFYTPSKLTARNLEFLVALHASPEVVERAVLKACREVDRVLQEPAPKVWLIAMTPLAQRYIVKFWLDDFQIHDDAESNVFKRIWYALQEEKIAIQASTPAFDPQTNQVVAVKT